MNQINDKPQPLSENGFTKAPKAQANGNTKSQATTEQLHHQSNGGVTGIRTQWQPLQDDKNNKQHAPFEPERLAGLKQKFPPFPSESERAKPQYPDPTNSPAQGINSAGIDLGLQSKTAWWGLLDVTKSMAATKTRLAESARFAQMSVAEVAYASAAIADLEEAVVSAQGELVLRQQVIRRLEEQVKTLVVELEERDNALAGAAADADLIKSLVAELQARERNGDAGNDAKSSAQEGGEPKAGMTRHVKWAADDNDKIVNNVIKLIQDLEYRYSLLRESLESTHTMFREALALAVPAFASHLAETAKKASDAAAQAALDAGDDNVVL